MDKSTDLIRPVATDKEQGRIAIFKTELADKHQIINMKLLTLVIKEINVFPPAKQDDGRKQDMGSNYQKCKSAQLLDLTKLSHGTVKTEKVF